LATPVRRDVAAASRDDGVGLCGRVAGGMSSWRYFDTD